MLVYRRLLPAAILALTLQATTCSSAAEADAVSSALPSLTQFAETAIARGDVPGLAIAIVHDGEVVYLRGFGVRQIGQQDPVGPDTVFPLASVSKPIASTVIASIVADGAIGWDTPIKTIDPSFEFYDPEATAAVTIRDLLSHRSGLFANAGNDLELIGYGRDDILSRLHLLPPVSPFRENFACSNYGFTIAATAAALAIEEPWETVAEQWLYRPLGMDHTSSRFSDFLAEANRVAYHTLIDGAWRPAPDHDGDAASPAGGVSSSARDLAAWMQLLLADGAFAGEQVIDATALAETQVPAIASGISPATGQPSSYGLGWSIDTDRFGRHVNHSGVFSGGMRALIDLMPEEDLGIVILANAYPSGVPEGLAAAFYELVFTGTSGGEMVERINGLMTEQYKQFLSAMSGALSDPASRPDEPLPPSGYVGVYTNDYVGDVTVAEDGDGLVLITGPGGSQRFALHHHDRDVFYIAPAPDTPGLLLPVVFTIGPDRTATDLRISLIGGPNYDRLRRAPEPAPDLPSRPPEGPGSGRRTAQLVTTTMPKHQHRARQGLRAAIRRRVVRAKPSCAAEAPVRQTAATETAAPCRSDCGRAPFTQYSASSRSPFISWSPRQRDAPPHCSGLRPASSIHRTRLFEPFLYEEAQRPRPFIARGTGRAD